MENILLISYFQRKSARNFYSIERIFSDVRLHLPEDMKSIVCLSVYTSSGLFRRLFDIIRARFYQGDINHVTGDVHFLTYLLTRRKTILTIHDFVMLERLTGIKKWIFWFFWLWLPEKRCSAITVVSEVTKGQLLKHLNCDPAKVRIIYNSVSEEFSPHPKAFNNFLPHLLFVGTTQNKNLVRVIRAIKEIKCRLMVAGALSAEQHELLAINQIDFENYVDLSREAVVKKYEQCDMLVFPSLYEGFGLPIIEANAIGRPVLTSNIWSMPEVAGDAACLVDPYDEIDIRNGILRIIEDAPYRDQLIKNGFSNVKRFKVDAVTKQYSDLYRELFI